MIRLQENKQQVNQEALSRARTNTSLSNYPAIFQGFMDRGIPEDQIKPRENIFTYAAWKALKRQVKRGEHGVKVITFIPMDVKDKNKETGEVKIKNVRRPKTTTVFHITQTEAI